MPAPATRTCPAASVARAGMRGPWRAASAPGLRGATLLRAARRRGSLQPGPEDPRGVLHWLPRGQCPVLSGQEHPAGLWRPLLVHQRTSAPVEYWETPCGAASPLLENQARPQGRHEGWRKFIFTRRAYFDRLRTFCYLSNGAFSKFESWRFRAVTSLRNSSFFNYGPPAGARPPVWGHVHPNWTEVAALTRLSLALDCGLAPRGLGFRLLRLAPSGALSQRFCSEEGAASSEVPGLPEPARRTGDTRACCPM